MLKQQLKDSQAEVTQKLSEIFLLKTQIREMRQEMGTKDGQVDMLQLALQAARHKGSLVRRTMFGNGSDSRDTMMYI